VKGLREDRDAWLARDRALPGITVGDLESQVDASVGSPACPHRMGRIRKTQGAVTAVGIVLVPVDGLGGQRRSCRIASMVHVCNEEIADIGGKKPLSITEEMKELLAEKIALDSKIDGTASEDEKVKYRVLCRRLSTLQLTRRFGETSDGASFPWKHGTSRVGGRRKSAIQHGTQSSKEDGKTMTRKGGLFTNGLGVDHDGFAKKHVETARKKKQFRDEHPQLSSLPLLNLASLWATKKKKHYFNDAMHALTVMTMEFGYTMEEFMGSRWFALQPSRFPPFFKLEYQRTMQCLDDHLSNVNGGCPRKGYSAYGSFSAIVDKLFADLMNPKTMLNMDGLKNWMETTVSPETFKTKINQMTEYVHLAHIMIEMLFNSCDENLTGEEKSNLMISIFGECKDRKGMACILFDMAMVYDSIPAVMRCGKLRSERWDASSLPERLKTANQRSYDTSMAELKKTLKQVVEDTQAIRWSKRNVGERKKTIWSVTRYRIMLNFRDFLVGGGGRRSAAASGSQRSRRFADPLNKDGTGKKRKKSTNELWNHSGGAAKSKRTCRPRKSLQVAGENGKTKESSEEGGGDDVKEQGQEGEDDVEEEGEEAEEEEDDDAEGEQDGDEENVEEEEEDEDGGDERSSVKGDEKEEGGSSLDPTGEGLQETNEENAKEEKDEEVLVGAQGCVSMLLENSGKSASCGSEECGTSAEPNLGTEECVTSPHGLLAQSRADSGGVLVPESEATAGGDARQEESEEATNPKAIGVVVVTDVEPNVASFGGKANRGEGEVMGIEKAALVEKGTTTNVPCVERKASTLIVETVDEGIDGSDADNDGSAPSGSDPAGYGGRDGQSGDCCFRKRSVGLSEDLLSGGSVSLSHDVLDPLIFLGPSETSQRQPNAGSTFDRGLDETNYVATTDGSSRQLQSSSHDVSNHLVEEDEVVHVFGGEEQEGQKYLGGLLYLGQSVLRSAFPVAKVNLEAARVPMDVGGLQRDPVRNDKFITEQWNHTLQSMLTGHVANRNGDIFVPVKKVGPNWYWSNMKERFENLVWARLEDVAKYNPTLYVKRDDYVLIFRCAPCEMYIALDLDRCDHLFRSNATEHDDRGVNSCQGVRSAERVNFEGFSALRLQSFAVSKHLETVTCNFPRLFDFVFNASSEIDRTRDGSCQGMKYHMRVDIGMAGLAWHVRKPGDKKGRPKDVICGRKFLDNHPEGEEIRRDIGQLVDAGCKIMDDMQRENPNFPHMFYSNEARFEQYGLHLRKYFFAQHMRVEWITIQIKCLDRGDITAWHRDTKNCAWVGYNVTGALSFVFMDGYGIFWSLKILLNSRKNIGDYYIPRFTTLFSAMKRQLAFIDQDYHDLMNNEYDGLCPPFIKPLSARNFRSMFLDDQMPWKEEDLTLPHDGKAKKVPAIMAKTFTLVAAPQRDLFLSLLVSAIRNASSCYSIPVKEQVAIIVFMSYQNSFKRTYYIMEKYKPTSARDYYNKMVEVFGSFKGGTDVRYSASGIDIERIFLEDEQALQRLDIVVNEILALLVWINKHTTAEDASSDTERMVINYSDYRDRVYETVKQLSVKLPKGLKCQIFEFRLLLIIQTCSLGGIVLTEHPFLTKLVFVAKNTGGHKFLYSANSESRGKCPIYGLETDDIMDTLGIALQLEETERGNAMESVACESQAGRREGNVVDVFMKGQDLFTIDRKGCRFMKTYGSFVWEPLR
jgi:hypothetical protein